MIEITLDKTATKLLDMTVDEFFEKHMSGGVKHLGMASFVRIGDTWINTMRIQQVCPIEVSE
jgi:hypothetical protein